MWPGRLSSLSHSLWVMGSEEETGSLSRPSLAEVVVLYFVVVSGFSVGQFRKLILGEASWWTF